MKNSIYDEITQLIVDVLDNVSTAEYKMPFAKLAAQGLPFNPITKNNYQGVNTLVLWATQQKKQYTSNTWATFKQWSSLGARIKRGEKSTRIIFFKKIETENDRDDENNVYFCMRHYNVFNACQVEDYAVEDEDNRDSFGIVGDRSDIEDYLNNTKAVIETGTDRAYYSLSRDVIVMPSKDIFFGDSVEATENYYGVLLHELTHWTGSESRLKRDQSGDQTSEAYAFEELVAELGSTFLCARFGIKQGERKDHAMYIKSWLTLLQGDKKAIFKAAAEAQKAVNFLDEVTSQFKNETEEKKSAA